MHAIIAGLKRKFAGSPQKEKPKEIEKPKFDEGDAIEASMMYDLSARERQIAKLEGQHIAYGWETYYRGVRIGKKLLAEALRSEVLNCKAIASWAGTEPFYYPRASKGFKLDDLEKEVEMIRAAVQKKMQKQKKVRK
jgi:hypothetical protein